ncbi:hypothetical protein BDV98DRAFT_573445 [Pterulicium gracile]|uniref:Transmembrane protein n=1 Tax=Pterulicium gracile TaxID=1884261 RepID=A0A5C3QD39_9AGAR|nr:hypothetical protein BDV98DRAFT_573445 [Pterula gracilis]
MSTFDVARAALASDYMRIASMTIWCFEILQTCPAELRIYKQQWKNGRMSVGCQLFIVVRYLGSAAIITSAVGYFGRGYSADFCFHYQRVAPLFKVISTLANQMVFLWRTYAISGRKRWVLITMSVAYFMATALQFFANSTTVPASSAFGNCLAGAKPGFRVSWVFYLAAMLYDFLVLGISWYFLLGSSGMGWTDMFGLTRALLTEGIAYVLLATFVNALNLIFFQLPVATTVQGMFATMGVAITALASQRILLHLLDPSADGFRSFHASSGYGNDTNGNIEVAAVRTIGGGYIRSPHSTSHAGRPQTKSRRDEHERSQIEMNRIPMEVRVDVERDADFYGGASSPHSSGDPDLKKGGDPYR